MIQTSIDVGPGSVEPWLEAVAFLTAITVLLAIVIAWKGLQYSGTDDEQRRQIRAVRGQILRMTPQRLTATHTDGFDAISGTIRSLLDRHPSDTASSNDVTIREAVADLGNELREASPKVPSLAIRGFVEGVLILVFGSVLFLSAAWWDAAVQPTDASPWAVATATATAIWSGLVSVVTLFPASETVWALVITTVVLVGEFLYRQWIGVGVALIVGALALAYANHATAEDLAVRLYPARLWTAGTVIAAVAGVWVIGTIPFVVLSGLGFETAGSAIGAGLSGLVSVGLVGLAIRGLARRLVVKQSLPDEHTTTVAGYLLIRKAFGVAVVTALPLLVAYVAVSVSTGALVEIGLVLLNAPLVTQLVLVFVCVAAVALLQSQFPEAIRRVQSAGRRAARSQAIRSWMFARGAPATAMVVAFALTWALFGTKPIGGVTLISGVLGLWPPVIAALVVGAVARALTLAWERVKYRILGYDRQTGKEAVTVDCFPRVSDADGQPLYVLRVDGHSLAHRDLDRLLEDARTVAEWYWTGGDNVIRVGGGGPPTTESRYYYEEVETGRVDIDDVRKAIRGDVYSRIKATFRAEDPRVPVTKLEGELQRDYPDHYWQRALSEYQKGANVSRRDDHYIQHGE